MSNSYERSMREYAELSRGWAEYCKSGGVTDRAQVNAYKRKYGLIFASALKERRPEPDQLPHPAHLDYDMEKGCMVRNGPINIDEKTEWEALKQQIRMNEAIIKRLIFALKRRPDDQEKLDKLRQAEFVITCLEKRTPVGWNCYERLGWEKIRDQKMRIF